MGDPVPKSGQFEVVVLKRLASAYDRKFLLFGLVGSVGFIVDAVVLTTLTVESHWGVIPSRLVSFSTATIVTWILNRWYTFSSPKTSVLTRKMEYFSYFVVQAVGAGLNLLIFLCLITWIPMLHQMLVIPLAVGALVAMVFNFLLIKIFVFKNTDE